MSARTWILGAPDPEMAKIEELARAAGDAVVYASADGQRVNGGSAWRATTVMTPGQVGRLTLAGIVSGSAAATATTAMTQADEIVLVECDLDVDGVIDDHGGTGRLVRVVRIDHHRPGDPGYGRPPAEYWVGSSLGQACAILGVEPTGELRIVAAADHCLRAAYAGECPGVEPDALARWRAESRAAHQGRTPDDVCADEERARELLSAAPTHLLGGVTVADMRPGRGAPCGEHAGWDGSPHCDAPDCGTGAPPPCHGLLLDCWGDVPELPEAACQEGLAFVAIPRPGPGPDGRRKVVLHAALPAAVTAWIDGEQYADCPATEDRYGDPARGFAGGYMSQVTHACTHCGSDEHTIDITGNPVCVPCSREWERKIRTAAPDPCPGTGGAVCGICGGAHTDASDSITPTTVRLSELTTEIRDLERQLASGSETELWGDYCEDMRRTVGVLPYGDAGDPDVPAESVAFWRRAYESLSNA